MSKISLIVTAGGTSSRFGKTNKLLEIVDGKTVIEYSVEAFNEIDEIFEIVIPSNTSVIKDLEEIFRCNKKVRVIEGGKTRQESVFKALKYVNNPDYVLIHDGARPLVEAEDVKKLIDKVKKCNSAILAVKTVDTIKKVEASGKIVSTIDRSDLYNVQTPQGFKFSIIYDAHKKLEGENYTDDAGMAENLGFPVYVVDGSYKNFKITTSEDLEKMKYFVTKCKK